MLESQLSRSEAMHFNTLASPASVIDWLEDEYWGLALQRGQPFGASDPAVADIVKRCDGMLI